MKVVFLCNRLSRTKLRGSWQALLEAGQAAQENNQEGQTAQASSSSNTNTVAGDMEVGRWLVWLVVGIGGLSSGESRVVLLSGS